MPVVIVEIAAPRPPVELTRALLDACSTAMRNGDCEAATDEEPTKAVAIAIVQWDGPRELRARVQVGVRRGTEADWQSRVLEFQKTDIRAERWRSVGLTIATLAGALAPPPRDDPGGTELHQEKTREPEAARVPAPIARAPSPDAGGHSETKDGTATTVPPSSAETEAIPSRTPRVSESAAEPAADRRQQASEGARSSGVPPPRGWLSAGATLGPGLLEGGPRFGGWLDAAWQPLPPAFARISLAILERGEDERGVSVQWNTVSIGGGVMIGQGVLSIQPRVAGSLERLRAAVTDPDSGRTDESSHLQLGIRLGTDVVLRRGSFGVVAGIDVWRNRATTSVVVGGQNHAADPQTGWAATLGVRYHFDTAAPSAR